MGLRTAWCEMRQDFRHFRTDRVVAAEFLDEHYGCRVSDLRNRWKRWLLSQGSRCRAVLDLPALSLQVLGLFGLLQLNFLRDCVSMW